MKKKKRFSFGKFLLILLLVIFLAAGGFIFYAYKRVNNIDKYSDKFVYDYHSLIKEKDDNKFEDHIYYDKVNHIFEYKVPAYYLYEIVNEESMGKILSLPEEMTIDKVGLDVDFGNDKVDIYLSVKYKEYFNTCLVIKTDIVLSEDKSQVELRYDDFFVIDEEMTEYLRQYVQMEKGELFFAHRFPVHVVYYRMPDYRPQFIFDKDYDGEYIYAKYDIGEAIKDYLATTDYHEDDFDTCMEKIYLEVRMNNIAHDPN
ncbi:MAG: hypothetical protein IJI46_02505 [Erysipelotrichaceae bacterium]|nr:hypothetical protein [Erysipelotrichaceae bacterium]